jgi:diaminohydroxyphosphoribosylaminopyrimidine deaminase/5-amino-6-(5-phosphoribosylamino)uracil reductase
LSRVVIGVSDPNPHHAGRAGRILRRRGLDVKTGVLGAAASELVAPFRKWILTGMPFVTLKLAMSMDGMIADSRGRSRWITGPVARRRVQALRRRADAIAVGASTARMDNPSLLPRPALGRRPLRVVVGGAGRLPADLALFRDAAADRTLVAHPAASSKQYSGLARRTGIELLPIASGRAARVPIRRLLRELAARDVLHVLCEGGGALASSLVRAGAVDEYQLFYAPCLLGGGATAALKGIDWPLNTRPDLCILEQERVGDDLWIRAHPVTQTTETKRI